MGEQIISFLNANGGSVGVAIFLSSWLIAAFYYKRFCKNEEKVTTHEADVSSLKKDMGEVKTSVSVINTEIGNIKESVKTIQGNIVGIYSLLAGTGKGIGNGGIINANSPLKLTPVGDKILVESGGKIFVDDNFPLFEGKISDKAPTTKFDVQLLSVQIILSEINNPGLSPVKNFLYNNPSFEGFNLNLNLITYVLGIYLRDKYLEKHPELN